MGTRRDWKEVYLERVRENEWTDRHGESASDGGRARKVRKSQGQEWSAGVGEGKLLLKGRDASAASSPPGKASSSFMVSSFLPRMKVFQRMHYFLFFSVCLFQLPRLCFPRAFQSMHSFFSFTLAVYAFLFFPPSRDCVLSCISPFFVSFSSLMFASSCLTHTFFSLV